MSGASDQVNDEGWVLVNAAPQPAASEGPSPSDAGIPNDDATAATAATAATVPPTTSHEEAVARGQSMAATAPSAPTVRPFDRLPDDGLAKVLAVLKQSEHRRVESVCQRWRQIRPRASLARVKSLRFPGSVVNIVARRFRNNQEDYYHTLLRFSNVGIGRKELLILDGTGDDFVVSMLHRDPPLPADDRPYQRLYLRMHPGTGVCKPPNHQVLTEDRAQATHFEAVETLFHGQREYYTLPDFFYFRLKGTQSFLKVHAWEQIGVLPQDLVTHRRNRRPNEGHAFKIHGFYRV